MVCDAESGGKFLGQRGGESLQALTIKGQPVSQTGVCSDTIPHMQRRSLLQSSALAAGALLGGEAPARGALPKMKITRIRYYHDPRGRPIFNQSSNVITVETDQGIRERKRESGTEYFRYSKFLMLEDFRRERLIDAVDRGDVLVDFDARTGHNHGTKFRLRQNKYPELYESVQPAI